ncbi:centriolin isoform X2 [Rhinatrema bivittatum]|uniref:centriolin isoform X2 n=1 Tax=Rhinatrema bivittatum TaxID=194408 RepID=UPI00112D592D|nr:centriolin isoform X2 [Rhinatrema bivittatum]
MSSPKSRTPSPPSRLRAPTTYKSREKRSQQSEETEESDVGAVSEHQAEKDKDGPGSGIRYITEDLVKKLTKQDNVLYVNSLNLCLAKDGGKKFKYIENLEKYERLEILSLANNLIEKIEKLDKQLKLRELNLSYNKISKIEGIEHMQNLHKLNLAGNEIEHIPAWLGKKLRCLSVLNLRQNNISSLQDVAKLKPLRDLTSLFLAENPVANLPHFRLYTVFHLRSLECLDGQEVTNQERQEAHERFNIEEVEKLERELERKMKEIEELKDQRTKVLAELQEQDMLNKSLKQKTLQQKNSYRELERDLDTKNELLKQKTLELTRACQKEYELEQELAFYKIDAKFEPLGYYPSEGVELDDAPGESPYIGKARYKRNQYAIESFMANKAQPIAVGKVDSEDQNKNELIQIKIHQALDIQLEDKERNIQAAQEKLTELQRQIVNAEQHILRVTEELKQLEDAVAQKKISEAEKENLRQQLARKIQILNQLRQEAQELESQMERQRKEMEKKQEEIGELQSILDSIDPKDPRHSHVKAQKTSKEQQLDMMNRHYKQLENRLDEMLSRIAKETEEIKDLEQQLTEGQIAANEALKKDLEGIITGLQEYLESVKGQAKQAHDECKELQNERDSLLQRVADMEEERNQLEIVAQDAENMRKELEELEQNLQEQQEINESLLQAQGDLSAYEAELEAQLQVRDAEAKQLKEELERRKRLSQMEHSAVRAELEKERQALENALSKAQISEEKEQENRELLAQLKQLQVDNNLLKKQLKNLQSQLDHAEASLIHPEQVTARVTELKKKLKTGAGEIRCHNASDILGKSLGELHKQINEILAHSQQEKEAAQERQRKLQEEIASLHDKLRDAPEDYKKACNQAAEAKIKSEKRQNEARVHQLENEIQRLHEKLKGMEEIQGLTDQQLQEADEERQNLLTELDDMENKRKLEDAKAQMQLVGLDKELKDLQRAMAASDKLATAELSVAKDQLKSLHGTVLKLNQERVQELQEAERFCIQAAQAARDLAKAEAEIELLHKIVKEKEKQIQDEREKADAGAFASDFQQYEIDKLNNILKRQKAETERLRHLLDHAREDNTSDFENLLDEIAALRQALSHQNDYITSMADPFRRRGYWYYVHSPSKASSPGSQSTKDSGVGLQLSATSSPTKKGGSASRHIWKEPVLPTRGHWVYSPFRSHLHRSHSSRDGGDGEDSGGVVDPHGPSESSFVPPLGSVIYTVLPDGAPVPQGTVVYGPPPPVPTNGRPFAPGTVIYGPPPVGTHFVYGPPPAHFSIPLIPAGVLHCNVPEHHDLENEISRLEDIVDHLRSRRLEEKWSEIPEQENQRAREKLQKNMQDLLLEKAELEHEVEELRRTAQKRGKRKDFIEGRIDSLFMELDLEKSLRRHEDIADEIECIEKTLLKRRAELREADRLLAEAETELQNTRAKTTNTIQRYSDAKVHLSHTEKDVEELERRAQDTAVKLVKADQQLRSLQADTRDLEQFKIEQENILKEINSVVLSRDSDFQSLNQKIGRMTESFQKLWADIQSAEGKENHYLQTLKEAENILQTKKAELERLKDQIAEQQQELVTFDRLRGKKEEELHQLQDSIDQKTVDLQEVLQAGETEVAEKRKQIRDVKSLLEELSVQKGELNAQISEKRAQLVLLKQEIMKEEDNLQSTAGNITKHKTELKHVLEMLQLENNELQALKLQHDQKVNELERTQVAVLEEKLEYENLQRSCQLQRGEVEWQKQVLDKDQQEIECLMAQMHSLQDSVQCLSKEKKHLEESCQSLENKLAQGKRVLTATEDCSKNAVSNLEKLESASHELQKELDQLSRQKQAMQLENTTIQQLLQEKKEKFDQIKDELIEMRDQLQLVEQDLKHATKRRDELLNEQAVLKGDIHESLKRHKELKEREERAEQQLQQLQRTAKERRQQLEEEEMTLQQVRKDVDQEKETLEETLTKLKDQKQVLEWELANQENSLEQLTAKVAILEERALKLQQEEKWCTTLEEALTETKYQLSEKEKQLQEKTNDLETLEKEMEISNADLDHLRDQLISERRKEEKRIAALKQSLKTQRSQLERALQEEKHDNLCLRTEMASIEQEACDSHERAKRLMKELTQLQQDYLELKKWTKRQEELEKRQQEINEAVKELKLEVKDELRTSLKDYGQPQQGLLEDIEAVFEEKENLQTELESLKENFPFAANEGKLLAFEKKLSFSKTCLMDEHWRGEALREKLRQHEDRLKAQLRQRMSKQADVLSKGKQQTEGSLQSLKKQVDALDELVSNTSGESPFQSQNSSGLLSLSEDTEPLPTQTSLGGVIHPHRKQTNMISAQSENFH